MNNAVMMADSDPVITLTAVVCPGTAVLFGLTNNFNVEIHIATTLINSGG